MGVGHGVGIDAPGLTVESVSDKWNIRLHTHTHAAQLGGGNTVLLQPDLITIVASSVSLGSELTGFCTSPCALCVFKYSSDIVMAVTIVNDKRILWCVRACVFARAPARARVCVCVCVCVCESACV